MIVALLARIGWSHTVLADRLHLSVDTTYGWVRGRRSTPPDVLTWLEQIAMAVESVGELPAGWSGVRPGRRGAG